MTGGKYIRKASSGSRLVIAFPGQSAFVLLWINFARVWVLFSVLCIGWSWHWVIAFPFSCPDEKVLLHSKRCLNSQRSIWYLAVPHSGLCTSEHTVYLLQLSQIASVGSAWPMPGRQGGFFVSFLVTPCTKRSWTQTENFLTGDSSRPDLV